MVPRAGMGNAWRRNVYEQPGKSESTLDAAGEIMQDRVSSG